MKKVIFIVLLLGLITMISSPVLFAGNKGKQGTKEAPAPPPPAIEGGRANGNTRQEALKQLKAKKILLSQDEFINRVKKGDIAIIKLFIDAGADVNYSRRYGETPLMIASEKGNIEVTKLLLARGAEVNSEGPLGITSLIFAIKNNHSEIVRLLLENGANPNKGYEEFIGDDETLGSNALESAVGKFAQGKGNINIIKLLLEKGATIDSGILGLSISQTNKEKQNILIKLLLENGADKDMVLSSAVGGDSVDIVKMVISQGVDINKKSDGGYSPLMKASVNGYHGMVKLLLDNGADIHAVNDSGETVLMMGAFKGNSEVVKVFLEKDIDIEAKDNNGKTALIYAAEGSHKDIVNLLLQKKANVNAEDNSERTALLIASENGNKDILEILLANGADVNNKNSKGWTALMSASSHGHNAVVNALISKGADVNAQNIKGWTALMSAAENGHTEVVKTLLAKGADVNAKTGRDWTALMSAVEKGQAEVVKVLLEKGADIEIKNIEGNSAFDLAHAGSNMDVINAVDARRKLSEDLIKAAGEGNIEAVKSLLGKFASVNARDQDGRSALVVAAMNGKKEVVKTLLDKGAKDVAVALFFAEDQVHDEIAVLLKEVWSAEIAKRHSNLLEKPMEQVKVEDAVTLLKTLRRDLKGINSQIENAIEIINAEYKKRISEVTITPKDEFETTVEHQHRVDVANEQKEKLERENDEMGKVVRTRFTQEVKEIEEDMKVLLDVESEVPEGDISIEFQSYSADEKKWPLIVHWKSPDGDYSVYGYVNIEGKDAKRLKEHEKALKFRGTVKIEQGNNKITLEGVAIVDEANGGFNHDVYFFGKIKNGVVTMGNLHWIQYAGNKVMTWDEAEKYIQNLRSVSFGGFSDWRFPTIEELKSFLSYCKSKGIIEGKECVNKLGFRNVHFDDYYWSSTASSAYIAWAVDIWSDSKNQCGKDYRYYVWPVRSGP